MLKFTLLFLFILLLQNLLAYQRSDCVDHCSHLDTSQEFGDCLKRCARSPRNDNIADVSLFASPPFDVKIETRVVMDEGKILETTIDWLADDADIRRTGFYVRYNAINATCQKHFPGFFTSSVTASERSLIIPAAFNGHSLIIDHSCSYHLQIRSIPYPAGDDKFIVEKVHTVPDCIGKYCSCQQNDVASIREVKMNGDVLKWKFNENEGREYVFFIEVYERIALPFKMKSIEDVPYTYRIANQEPFEANVRGNNGEYSFKVPFEFGSLQEYKVSVFAVDDRFCHNDDAVVIFNTTNLTSVSEPLVTSTIPNIDLNRPPINASKPIPIESEKVPHVLMESTAFFIFLLVIACMSPLCTLFAIFMIKRKNNLKKRQTRKFLNRNSLSCSRHSIMETNILYRPPQEIIPLEWQIRGQDVAVGTVIGEGAFGLVFKGVLRGPNGQVVRVAVKQLKANALDEEKEEFVREIQMMQTVGQHDNIITMYGFCMDENLQCMIMEYVPFGDLKHYLQNVRKQQAALYTKNPEESINLEEKCGLDPDELLNFSCQISNGMAHLEGLGIIHRDLAARNILVGNGKILKISDFGMSRPGVYIKMSKGVIPLRWLSPEAIKENMYSAKSDVWAYGVLLWEIATLGGFPYGSIADKDILNNLIEGNRLEKPVKCSDEVYNLMKLCWSIEARDRPSFLSIFQQLHQSINDEPPNESK